MTLDRTLAKEIKALNGDGSRGARFDTFRRVEVARKDLSTPEVRDHFNDCIRKHGRAVVAICVAATLHARRERIDFWEIRWALEVLDCWTNRGPSFIDRSCIDDQLHPTRICEYAGSFIRATTEANE